MPPSAWPLSQWKLPDLTLAAFYYNPALRVARAQVAEAEAAMVTARARPNPSASGDVGGETAPENPWIAGFVGSLPIETAGKRARRITAAERTADGMRWNLAVTAWKVRAQVRSALLEYITAGRSLALLQTEERLRAGQALLLQQRLAVGMIPRPELDAAQIQHTQAMLAATAAETRLDQARAALAAAIGVPASGLKGSNFVWPDFDNPPAQSSFNAAAIQEDAVLNRLDIREALAEYAASEAALQLQVARQYPDFNLGPDYAFEEGSHLFSVVLGLALPVFNRNQGPIAEAKARREQMAAVHRIDVEQPVAADQQRREEEDGHRAQLHDRLPDLRPATGERDEDCEERQRPQHPVGDDIERSDGCDGLEVERQDAPQGISAKAEKETVAGRSGVVHPPCA